MSTDISSPAPDALTPHQRALEHALEQIGWKIEMAYINLTSNRPSAYLSMRRADGLMLTLDAQHGRATLTREMPSMAWSVGGRYGCWENVLIGRDKWHSEGIRSDLRRVGLYLGDNPAPHIAADRRLGLDVMRALLAPSLKELTP